MKLRTLTVVSTLRGGRPWVSATLALFGSLEDIPEEEDSMTGCILDREDGGGGADTT